MNYRIHIESLRARVARVVGDTRGAVLVYVTLLMPVLIGGAVLVIDGARLSHLQTDLQKGADALALVGAAELDRKPDAITRATAAVANLTSNTHKFSTSGTVEVAVSSLRFLQSLPASDADSLAAATVAPDAASTRFVEVTVNLPANSFRTIFPASLLGGSNTTTTGARAVAGFDAAVCKFTPMYICNPYQGTGTSIFEAVNDSAMRRRQIELRKQGGTTAQNSAGNYGFMLPPGMADDPTLSGSGASALRQMIGRVSPPACFVQNGVELKTGFIASVQQAINVRFDLYEGAMNSEKGNEEFRPARNVRKGYSTSGGGGGGGGSSKGGGSSGAGGGGGGSACNPSPDESGGSMGLPRDPCFASGTCPHMSGRMGNGNWDCPLYWATNFGAAPLPPGCAVGGTASRYDVYRHEIDNNLVATPSPVGETGVPACYSGGAGTLSDNPDRRVLYGAVLDCTDLPSGGSGGPVPVVAFAKFFLTEPVPGSGDNNIYVELIGVVEPGTVANDVARDLVQLYR